MEILQDIEKNILNINMYDKTADSTKLNLIKKQISDYFKYKSDEMDIIMRKKGIYDEKYKNVRELNNATYELFLVKKEELYNIYRESKSLASLYDYLNYKYPDYKGYPDYKTVPEIYTYDHINLEERVVIPSNKDNKCPPGKVLNPKTKKCVKEKAVKPAKPADDDDVPPKVPKAPKEPKEKKPKVPKVDKPPKVPKEPKEPKVPKEKKQKVPKADKAPKAPKDPKTCPEGKVLNPVTNRCINDVNNKP
jgi:hypothetical protein